MLGGVTMIEYKNVALRYAEKNVLKDVNLRIEDGEFMVLVGPSGSGKTTMMKMINQLIEPTDGNIYLNQKRIKDHHQREVTIRNRICFATNCAFSKFNRSRKYCLNS